MSVNHPLETQNKTVNYDNINYLINEVENTAGVIDCEQSLNKIIIPRSIKQGSKEYEVTSILDNAFAKSKIKIVQFASDSKLQTIGKYAFAHTRIKNITIPSSVTFIGEGSFLICERLKEIKIPEDSKLQTIEKDVFCYTKIKSLYIPSELIELKEGWCNCTTNMTQITVSPKNPRYFCYEEKMIIGKTNIEQSNYDCLIFVVRVIQQIKIPDFIEHICPYSFDHCEQLENIEFSNDSKLQTIDKHAFNNSTIKSIRIPSSVTSIKKKAFSVCFNFERIEIPDDSKLQTIEKDAFINSKFKSLYIPSELVELKEGWCSYTSILKKITVSPKNPRYCFFDDKMIIGKTNIEQSNYDCLVFCVRNVKHIKIPDFIEHICSYSFDFCRKLESIEFSNDSKLQTIGDHAFDNSSIKSIRIPSSVTSIGEGAFKFCTKQQRIEIPEDSKLQTIEKDAFFSSTIESLRIPSELVELKDGWCNNSLKLTKIEISPKNPRYFCYEDKMIIGKTNIEQSNYDCLIFVARDIQQIKIPDFIVHICPYSFHRCEQIYSIEFSNDSKLQTIKDHAILESSIRSIRIPSSVTSIGERAFYSCDDLEVIEIPEDSKLQTIGNEAFTQSSIKSLRIPSSVTLIESNALYFCSELQIIEVDNIEQILVDQKIIYVTPNALVMVHVHNEVITSD